MYLFTGISYKKSFLTADSLEPVLSSFQVGLLDLEINTLTKVLFTAVVVLSIVMMLLKVGIYPFLHEYSC